MIDFNRVKSSVDLREVAHRYTTLNKNNQGPCPICGGTDRFYIHKGGDRCGCRGCDFQGDAIELVHKVEGVNRAEAAKLLGGKQIAEGNHQLGRSKPNFAVNNKEPAPAAWQGDAWQTRAWLIVERAEVRLIGSPGAAYFEGRGITLETCKRFRLGYVPEQFGRPVVVIPWLDGVGTIRAIKYRYIKPWIDAKGRPQRYSAESGSAPLLFGLIGCRGSETLVVVEGEINALALAQSISFDVLSIGSDGNGSGIEELGKLVAERGYDRILFWLDEEVKVKKIIQSRFPNAAPMKSPGGKDAADLLVEVGPAILKQLVDQMLDRKYQRPLIAGDSSVSPPESGLEMVDELASRLKSSTPRIPDRDLLNQIYSELGPGTSMKGTKKLLLALDEAAIKGQPQLCIWLGNHEDELVDLLRSERTLEPKPVRAALKLLFP